MLNVLCLCTQRARGGIQHEVGQLLHLLQDTSVHVFVKLWDIRDSFLLSELTGFEDDSDESTVPFYEVDILFSTLNTLGRLPADLTARA